MEIVRKRLRLRLNRRKSELLAWTAMQREKGRYKRGGGWRWRVRPRRPLDRHKLVASVRGAWQVHESIVTLTALFVNRLLTLNIAEKSRVRLRHVIWIGTTGFPNAIALILSTTLLFLY